jgi:hypothetical protein
LDLSGIWRAPARPRPLARDDLRSKLKALSSFLHPASRATFTKSFRTKLSPFTFTFHSKPTTNGKIELQPTLIIIRALKDHFQAMLFSTITRHTLNRNNVAFARCMSSLPSTMKVRDPNRLTIAKY